MSVKYKIAETESFSRQILKRGFEQVYYKLTSFVYPQLKDNPHFGNNIKKLKGEYEGMYRYRVGSYRAFYVIDDNSKTVFILEIQKRKDSYK